MSSIPNFQPTDTQTTSTDESYRWTRIREERYIDGLCFLRVQWRGCAPPQDTWEELGRFFRDHPERIPDGYTARLDPPECGFRVIPIEEYAFPYLQEVCVRRAATECIDEYLDGYISVIAGTREDERLVEWRKISRHVRRYLGMLSGHLEDRQRVPTVSSPLPYPVFRPLPTSKTPEELETLIIENIAAVTAQLDRWHPNANPEHHTVDTFKFVDTARGINGEYNGMVQGQLELHQAFALVAVGVDCLRGRRFEDQCWVKNLRYFDHAGRPRPVYSGKHISASAKLARICINLGNSSPLIKLPDIPLLSYSIPSDVFTLHNGDTRHQKATRAVHLNAYKLARDSEYSVRDRSTVVDPQPAVSYGIIPYIEIITLAERHIKAELKGWKNDPLMTGRLVTLQRLMDRIDAFPERTRETSNFVLARRAISAVVNAYGPLPGTPRRNALGLLSNLRSIFCMSILSSRPDLYCLLSSCYVFESWVEFASNPPEDNYKVHRWLMGEVTIWGYNAMQCAMEGYHKVSRARRLLLTSQLPPPDPSKPLATTEDKVLASIRTTCHLALYSCNKTGCLDPLTCTYDRNGIDIEDYELLESLRRLQFGTGTRDRRELMGL
ncbi:hypothetical protein IAR55_003203 [Kwoniella newhampshirensis]|uniref:Chromo domain-containing protein n=1 Tax=Kwoniella newhampshirensis TaxID=1651941 RepID=A0AAW0YZ07_9TREE